MRYLSLLVLLFLASYASAQKNVIDKIIAVVGEEIVLKSDIENQFLHEQSQGLVNSSADSRTRILENLLVQKLLVAQAKIDSIEVTDTEVENALNLQLAEALQNVRENGPLIHNWSNTCNTSVPGNVWKPTSENHTRTSRTKCVTRSANK